MKRTPSVAHQFYPGDAATLDRTLANLIPRVSESQKKKAIAVISPHAGYVYSGAVAGETFAQVHVPKNIVLLGPNHHGRGARVALMSEGSWQMPSGDVPINTELAQNILRHSSAVTDDELAHRYEHSLEVQVPFMQRLQPGLTLAPIVVSHISYLDCAEVGRAIGRAITDYGRSTLIVASTDMTHYESREAASRKDRLALSHIESLDPEGLYNTVLDNRISMCGIMPTTIALVAAIELGARRADLVRYTDSGEISGDTHQVVGYAGFVIS